MDQTNIQLWKREHPKANVPALIAENALLVDTSWHNDAMPSFELAKMCGGQKQLRLWVDYEDPSLSECHAWDQPYKRYLVSFYDWDKNSDPVDIYHGNDPQAAIDAIVNAVVCVGWNGQSKPIIRLRHELSMSEHLQTRLEVK